MKLLLVGGTGLVGSEVLNLALAEPKIETLVVPSRRPLDIRHPKLITPVVDFESLPADAAWWQVDAAICALGTTIKVAGSREAFRRVDHDYPLAVARLARAHGASRLAVITAKGANSRSPFFYSQVKGELEADLTALGFPSLTLVRPGLIGGARSEARRRQSGLQSFKTCRETAAMRLPERLGEAVAGHRRVIEEGAEGAMRDAAFEPVGCLPPVGPRRSQQVNDRRQQTCGEKTDGGKANDGRQALEQSEPGEPQESCDDRDDQHKARPETLPGE